MVGRLWREGTVVPKADGETRLCYNGVGFIETLHLQTRRFFPQKGYTIVLYVLVSSSCTEVHMRDLDEARCTYKRQRSAGKEKERGLRLLKSCPDYLNNGRDRTSLL